MDRRIASLLSTVVIAAACSAPAAQGTAGPPSAAPTSAASAAPPSTTVTPAATPSGPTTFTSLLYKYTVTVPEGWTTSAALLPWDGVSQPGHEQAEVDKFVPPSSNAMAWGFAGPVSMGLNAFVQDRIKATARDHGDTCPTGPEVNEPVAIGNENGVFLAWDCGILINEAQAIRDGIAYVFVMRDLDVHAATDPTDRALLQALLDSVQFPS
jgi:hypothetical protein